MKHEIRAVKLVGDNYERCDESDPAAVWGLYEIDASGLSQHVEDFATKADAERALANEATN